MAYNVAFLIGSVSGGGAERVISNLSRNFSDGINTHIYVIKNDEIDYPHGGKLIEICRVWEKLPKNNKNDVPIIFYPMILLILLFNIRKENKKNDIDVVISFLPMANLLNVLSGTRVNKILSARNYQSISNTNLLNKISMVAYKSKYPIVSVSESVKDDLVKKYNIISEKITTIYNPVDIDFVLEKSNEKIETKYLSIFDNPVIINIGRLVTAKQQDLLISAFNVFKNYRPEYRLVVLGDGPLKKSITNYIIENNLDGYIYLLGNTNNPFKYLNHSDLYISTSRVEGMSNSMLEAMALSKPIISTDSYSGSKELLCPTESQNENIEGIEYCKYGILLPMLSNNKENAEMLCDMLLRITDNNDILDMYKLKSKERAMDFKIETIVKRWEDYIDYCIRIPGI